VLIKRKQVGFATTGYWIHLQLITEIQMEELVNQTVSWFNAYYGSFENLDQTQQVNFGIKKNHSERVALLAMALAEKMKWTPAEVDLAYLAGLLHDVGRFRQLLEFNTFDDEKSVDHADLGVKILTENEVLKSFDDESCEIIFQAIKNHNKLSVNHVVKGKQLSFVRLLRDADKIDILKVLSEYYNSKNGKPNHTLTWELPKNPEISKNVLKEILSGKMVSKKNVVTENDVKIMQLSWVFDLNYKPSFEHLAKCRYLESIYNTLPKNDVVIDVYRKVKVFVENRILN
jgi:putative nucleotidyltransferase with HDIG domain